MENTHELLTIQEAAKIAKVSDGTARILAKTHWKQFSLKIGRRHKISKAGLSAWVAAQMATSGGLL